MTQLSRNIIANLAGKLCNGLLSLGLIPLYVRLMGVESYGLVGVFASFQAVLLLLDMGLSTTLNRELARLPHQKGGAEARDWVRTMEVPYWGAASVVLIVAWPLGSLIALHWVQPGHLSPASTQKAFSLMGLAVGLQFPFTLYSGGLMGLQRQVLLNGIVIASALFRGLGAAAVLWLVDPGIHTFMCWQILASALQTIVAWRVLWSALPTSESSPRVRKDLLLGRWRFAGGVFAVTALSVILTQMDKVVLSNILPLEQFGYYAMASAVAGALSVMVSPLFSAVFPRFSQLAVIGDQEALKLLYHKSCQMMAVLILPPAIVLAIFSREIMILWTQNPTTAEHTWRLVSVLIVGAALNGLMNIPYALQLAHGWTRLSIVVNLVAIMVLIPMLVLLSLRWGSLGAAWVWPILNAAYVLFSLSIMHRRLLPGELWHWYWADSGLPLLAALSVSAGVRFVVRGTADFGWNVAAILVASLLSPLAAGLVSRHVRIVVVKLWRERNTDKYFRVSK